MVRFHSRITFYVIGFGNNSKLEKFNTTLGLINEVGNVCMALPQGLHIVMIPFRVSDKVAIMCGGEIKRFPVVCGTDEEWRELGSCGDDMIIGTYEGEANLCDIAKRVQSGDYDGWIHFTKEMGFLYFDEYVFDSNWNRPRKVEGKEGRDGEETSGSQPVAIGEGGIGLDGIEQGAGIGFGEGERLDGEQSADIGLDKSSAARSGIELELGEPVDVVEIGPSRVKGGERGQLEGNGASEAEGGVPSEVVGNGRHNVGEMTGVGSCLTESHRVRRSGLEQ
jgi:hypothetical protein